MFQGTKITIAKKIGHEREEKFFNGSIYLIGIGINDYINNYLNLALGDSWEYSPDDFFDYLVSTLRQQRVMTTDGSFQQNVNEYAVKFNAAVKNLIADLNSKLPAPGFIFTDGYDFFMKLIEDPQAYGSDNSDTPCCSIGGYRPILTCVFAAKLCRDRNRYLFWDEYLVTLQMY
eukprot:PITA_34557